MSLLAMSYKCHYIVDVSVAYVFMNQVMNIKL